MLEAIVKELNPVHDFDRFRFYKLNDIVFERDIIKRNKIIVSNGRFLLWTPKVMIRGLMLGAAMGGMVGILSDSLSSYEELYRAMAIGGIVGYRTDLIQYWVRGLYHLMVSR